jgi:hypothetical protein
LSDKRSKQAFLNPETLYSTAQPDKIDSVYHFYPNNINNAKIFIVDSMQHEDFDCFSLIVKKSGNCFINQRYNTALNLAVSFLEDNLKNENHFSATVEKMNNVTKKNY